MRHEGIDYAGGEITVIQLLERYISLKRGVRYNTTTGYKFVMSVVKKEPFGQRIIRDIKMSDAKLWFIKLYDDGYSYSTIASIRGVVKPAFQMAYTEDIIRRNPFEFRLDIIPNNTQKRVALSPKQQEQFLEFTKNDKHFCRYLDEIKILLGTGMRISELCGLTISDLDFDRRRIRVDHQLQRTRDMKYVIEDTKTESGERMVLMTPEVKEAFQRILANRKNPKVEPMVDGYSGFLFLDKNGRPMVALHWEKYFQHIREKYNKIYKVQMPKVTPHVCRHTFCSNMAKSGMNPKTLQYIMGHSEIGVTLNTYTHLGYEDAEEEMQKIVDVASKKSTMHRKKCVS